MGLIGTKKILILPKYGYSPDIIHVGLINLGVGVK